MLCQAVTAAVFSSCLFLECFSFSFAFSNWNAFSVGFRWLIWPLQNIPLLLLKKRLLSKHASGQCQSALRSSVQWVLKHLAVSEQIIAPRALFSSHHSGRSSWSISHLICPQDVVAELYWCYLFIRFFWHFLSRAFSLPCLVNPLYLLWWGLLLIVDVDSETNTKVVRDLTNCCEGVFTSLYCSSFL